MAINFSASFAACLAAGLKVPRQIMYCISQDTPYGLYKDSQDGSERAVAGGQWSTEVYPAIQGQAHIQSHNVPQIAAGQQTQAQNQPQQQQQTPQSPPNHDTGQQQQQTNNEPINNGQLSSPATSPYPPNQNNSKPPEIPEDINQVRKFNKLLWVF